MPHQRTTEYLLQIYGFIFFFRRHFAGDGQTIGREAEVNAVGHIVLAGGGLLDGEDTGVWVFGALVGLEALVLQFRTQCTPQGLVLHRFVLVEDTDDAGLVFRGDIEQLTDEFLRLLVVIDVAHDIAYTVEDDEVRPADRDGGDDM